MNSRMIRHMAYVPRGFLRHYVLKLLQESPMSGSEITDRIEKATEGRWAPSPGSVYPLLAWLQDNGYIEELSKEGTGIKRYRLTKKGKAFLQEEEKAREKIRRRLGHFAFPFFDSFGSFLEPEGTSRIAEPMKRLHMAVFDFRTVSEEKPSERSLTEIEQILNDASQKIEELGNKIREAKMK